MCFRFPHSFKSLKEIGVADCPAQHSMINDLRHGLWSLSFSSFVTKITGHSWVPLSTAIVSSSETSSFSSNLVSFFGPIHGLGCLPASSTTWNLVTSILLLRGILDFDLPEGLTLLPQSSYESVSLSLYCVPVSPELLATDQSPSVGFA